LTSPLPLAIIGLVLEFTFNRPNRADDSYEEEGILLVGCGLPVPPSAPDSKSFLSAEHNLNRTRACVHWSFMPGECLNSNHARRLSVTCRHIGKALADMENALAVVEPPRNCSPDICVATGISPTAATELSRIAVELMSLTTEFDHYVTSEVRALMESPEGEIGNKERDDTNCSNT
jgi:hypothetical protein